MVSNQLSELSRRLNRNFPTGEYLPRIARYYSGNELEETLRIALVQSVRPTQKHKFD